MGIQKSFIEDSRYIRKLLKNISKLSNFSSVPEELYYGALVTSKYLKELNIDSDTSNILYSFVKMCKDSKLSVDSYGARKLFLLKKKKFTNVKVSSSNINIYSYIRYKLQGTYKPIIVSVLLLCIYSFIGHQPTVWGSVGVILGGTLLFFMVYFLLGVIFELYYYVLPNTLNIAELDIYERTCHFARCLPRKYKKLVTKLINCDKDTKEFYDIYSDIEMAYIREYVL